MADIRFLNQYKMTGGFNITSGEPIDSRMYVADIAHILLDSNWSTVKPYPGLIVSAPDGQVRVFAPQTGQTYKDADAWLEIGGGAAIVVEKYDDALTAATSKNIGTIVYVTNNPETGVTNTGSKYNGAYVVSGANSLSKLGTTTVGEDIAGEVTALQGKVGSLEVTVNGNDENEGLVKKVADLRTDLNTLDGEAVKGIKMHGESEEVLSPADGIVTLSWDTNVQENSPLPATSGAVYSHVESKIETAKLTIDDKSTTDGALKSYKFMQGTTEVGTIDIPKDLVVTEGKIVIGDGNNGTTLGEKYLELTIGNQDVPVYIAVKDLVDVYTSGNYITVGDDNTISVNISEVDSKLAENASAVGGRIKAVEDDIATLYTEDFTEEGSIVKIISDATEKLIESTADGVKNHALSELKAVAEAAYTPGGDKIAREDLDDSTKASLTLADKSVQHIQSASRNQLSITHPSQEGVENKSDYRLTLVTVSSDELIKVGTKDEVAGSPEKLLTAGVAKEYIDSLWDWEMLD